MLFGHDDYEREREREKVVEMGNGGGNESLVRVWKERRGRMAEG